MKFTDLANLYSENASDDIAKSLKPGKSKQLPDGTWVRKDRGGNILYTLSKNGKIHRLDGPAYEYADGAKGWWVNGKIHRLDGPAYEYADGTKGWWVNGKQLSEEDFNQHPEVIRHRRIQATFEDPEEKKLATDLNSLFD
jgi:hypothetical protein